MRSESSDQKCMVDRRERQEAAKRKANISFSPSFEYIQGIATCLQGGCNGTVCSVCAFHFIISDLRSHCSIIQLSIFWKIHECRIWTEKKRTKEASINGKMKQQTTEIINLRRGKGATKQGNNMEITHKDTDMDPFRIDEYGSLYHPNY